MKTNYSIEITVDTDMGIWTVKIGPWSKTLYCKDDVNYYLDQFKMSLQ